MKGISAVVAVILVLIITIGLGASAWMLISGIITGRVTAAFSIVTANYGDITIRNDGTAPISSLSATVDEQPVTVLFPDGPIEPGEIGVITLQGLPPTKQKHTLRLCSPGMCSQWTWEYPIIAVYDADGDGFYLNGWGRFSSNQIVNWLNESGFAVYKISSDDLASLVGYWKLDEGSDITTRDSSGNFNEGTLINFDFNENSDWTIDCKSGSCLKFDGVNDYVEIPHSSSFDLNQLTIELWIKTPTSMGQTWRNVFSKSVGGRDYGLWMHSSSPYEKVDGLHQSSTVFGASLVYLPEPYEPNSWHHVVVTIDTSGLHKYYSDGEFVDQYQGTPGTANRNSPVWIGRSDNYWNGIIDEVRLYNRALSEQEIKERYKLKKLEWELSNFDIFIISTGEGYPARGKSYGTNGGNIWKLIKWYMKHGGKMLVIGAWPFYYPGRWDGSTWVDDCNLVPTNECRSGGGRALELYFGDVDGNSIIKTADGEMYFPNSADSASDRDRRPLRGWPGEFNPENELIRLWNTDTGNYAISMVKYKDGIYSGAILKVSGGGPDHVTALGGKTFIVEAVLTLLKL
jgi:hypothetical protein